MTITSIEPIIHINLYYKYLEVLKLGDAKINKHIKDILKEDCICYDEGLDRIAVYGNVNMLKTLRILSGYYNLYVK